MNDNTDTNTEICIEHEVLIFLKNAAMESTALKAKLKAGDLSPMEQADVALELCNLIDFIYAISGAGKSSYEGPR